MNSRSEIRRLAVQNPDALIEEIERLRAENEKLSNSLVPICQHERHQILHETNICEEEKALLRSDNDRLREVLERVDAWFAEVGWQGKGELPATIRAALAGGEK